MPEVFILRIVCFTVNLERNVVLFSVLDFVLTALEFPSSPRSDNLHIRSISLDSKFKTNLVVTLTCATVANSVSALGFSNFYKSFSNDRTSERCAEEVLALINCACLNGRNDVIVNKLLVKVFNVKFRCACLNSLFLKTVKLCALSYITRNSDNLAVVIVFF